MERSRRDFPKIIIAVLASCASAVTCASEKDWSEIYLGACPSVNADGSRFVFEWNDSIWIAPTAGGMAERLTPEESLESWPALSPDGTRVAYLSSRDGGYKIFVMDLATMRVSQMSRHSEPTGISAWAPDGTRVVGSALRDHAATSDGWRIAFFSPDGGETFPLAHVRSRDAALSPDGRLERRVVAERDDFAVGAVRQDVFPHADHRRTRPAAQVVERLAVRTPTREEGVLRHRGGAAELFRLHVVEPDFRILRRLP